MHKYRTMTVSKVGQTTDPLCLQSGLGVFNFDSVLDYLSQPVDDDCTELTIDLSTVGWISLFDWWIFTCILHGQLKDNAQLKILLDFMGDRDISEIIPYNICADYLAGRIITPSYLDADYRHSAAIHRVINFIKSLEGPSGFKNVAGGRLALARIGSEAVGRPGWYRVDSEIENSVILPRTNVGTKEMCLLFASRQQIENWREAMAAKRVPKATVFHSEEFWRVLCHELARNVVEHADGPGFITGRVVLPKSSSLPIWCSAVYDSIAQRQLEAAKERGFVELCVSDAGRGIPATIEKAFMQRFKERNRKDIFTNSVSHTDLIKFAFDELGTSKDSERSWITDRHALGHMLYVIAKYGGVLTIRSGNAELVYCAEAGAFQRCETQMGFEPQKQIVIHPYIKGTHIQLLIPLTTNIIGDFSYKSKFYHHLPQSFHIDRRHPLGPLVPVRDKLLSLCIESDETIKFKDAVEALGREILQGPHTRDQLMVFDFGEVDWTPAQFETFLFLMQNVLLTRPVLFTQVSREFADIVNTQEDEERPTYLPVFMKDKIEKLSLEREFTEGRFLETYSGLGVVVLALGPDQGEYLFGVRGNSLRAALLEIINNGAQTISELCNVYGLDSNTFEAVLNQSSLLFKPIGNGRWESVFMREAPDRDDLEVQRFRALTHHFDIVADHCGAWRGRRNSRTSKTNERFYLPTEDAVYTEFLETSRILSRERYCIEIAERLIFRLYHGLSVKGLTLHDVDILACSTTPTVMLAEAIRRAWPVEFTGEHEGTKPVVIDYGPSLFSGADPAHIPVKTNGKLCAVVVHDLFDEGTLSKKLVSLAELQGIEVLFVLSFIRFLKPEECTGNNASVFPVETGWNEPHPTVNKPVHAMIGLLRPHRDSKAKTHDWGVTDNAGDYVVDPRSLRPVSLNALRLESGYSNKRALTTRDPYLKELDLDGGTCRLAAGHFVYGQRHFAVVADVRGILTGNIGHEIVRWLADLCLDNRNRNAPWEKDWQGSFEGEVTAILLPLHSQIHYILPSLQIELAQRGRRVPHFFLDATSFGGGVEIYDIPYQLQNQIGAAVKDIKEAIDELGTDSVVKQRQLRLLIIDDAIFSGRTLQTVLDSLDNHVRRITKKVNGEHTTYPPPIEWIRAFAVLNELPSAKSALWHNLRGCAASSHFRFDEFAPFIGVATFSSADCPACRELEQLDQLTLRMQSVAATDAVNWLTARKTSLAPMTIEAPYFREIPSPTLPEPLDVLVPPGGGAPDRYKPLHADSAIWRFYELVYLSYPLDDVLLSLKRSRDAGLRHVKFRSEYARFRLAVYDWCIQNWHQVRLYHAENQVFDELKAEIEMGEAIFVAIIHRLSHIMQHESVQEDVEPVVKFVRWAIDFMVENDADSRQSASETTLALDTALTLLFFTLGKEDCIESGILAYLDRQQSSMFRKNSFLANLYRRCTQPTNVADPKWALTTIAEICYRGRVGDTPEAQRTTDHELLGRLVAKTERNPSSEELRRRLEGCLHAFIAAESNLKPYFDDYLLSKVRMDADNVLDWLRLPLAEGLTDVTPLVTLSNSMQTEESWAKFAENCHMSAGKFKKRLFMRLADLKADKPIIYNDIALEVELSSEVERWCLMTDMPKLASYISNIALEPAKRTKQLSCSKVIIKPCEDHPNSITIEVITHYGSAETAGNIVNTSGSIAHEISRLELFGVIFDRPLPIASEGLCFKLYVPIGFQIKG